MPNFKDPAGKLHYLDDAAFAHLLPEDCVEISDKEAQQIVAASIVPLTYAEQRAAEYPPPSDYLDGVVKGDQAQIDAYIAKCKAIKAKYPKP